MNIRLPDLRTDIQQIDNLIADCEEDIPPAPQIIKLDKSSPWYAERKCQSCSLTIRYYLPHLKVAKKDFRRNRRRARLCGVSSL